MKVAIYSRVSTDNKDQDPKRQLDQCKNYIDLHNHELLTYQEDYVTGNSNPFEREGFKQILNHKVEGIVIYEISRFSREYPTKVLRRISELKDKGIKIISITEPAFNMEGDFADLLQYIMSWFNNYFLTNLKRNVKSGIERARKQGKQIGRAKIQFNKFRAYNLLFIEKKPQRYVSKELNVSLSTINRFKKVCDKNPDLYINKRSRSKTDVKGTED